MPPNFPRLLRIERGQALVTCPVCRELVHRKGDGFAVHIPKSSTRPCPTSWGSHNTKKSTP